MRIGVTESLKAALASRSVMFSRSGTAAASESGTSAVTARSLVPMGVLVPRTKGSPSKDI